MEEIDESEDERTRRREERIDKGRNGQRRAAVKIKEEAVE